MKVIRSTQGLMEIYDDVVKRPIGQNELSILGCLHSAIRGLWNYEAVTNRWPDFSGLVLKPLQLEPRKSEYREVYLYGESHELHQLLMDDKILPWNECITFRATPAKLKSVLHNVASHHGGTLLDSGSNYQYYQVKDISTILETEINNFLPKCFRVGSVEQQHLPYMQTLMEQYSRKGASHIASKETQEIWVRDTFSACIYNADGKPVSWALAHLTGEAVHAFTDPDYRGAHLYGLVGIYFVQQAYQLGQAHVYAIAKTANKSAQSAAKTHFKVLPQLVTHFHYIPQQKAKM